MDGTRKEWKRLTGNIPKVHHHQPKDQPKDQDKNDLLPKSSAPTKGLGKRKRKKSSLSILIQALITALKIWRHSMVAQSAKTKDLPNLAPSSRQLQLNQKHKPNSLRQLNPKINPRPSISILKRNLRHSQPQIRQLSNRLLLLI